MEDVPGTRTRRSESYPQQPNGKRPTERRRRRKSRGEEEEEEKALMLSVQSGWANPDHHKSSGSGGNLFSAQSAVSDPDQWIVSECSEDNSIIFRKNFSKSCKTVAAPPPPSSLSAESIADSGVDRDDAGDSDESGDIYMVNCTQVSK